MNLEKIKIRASQLYKIMTKARKKSENLSETAKSYLEEVYIFEKYGISKEISSKYLTKGVLNEDQSINILNEIYKKDFYKNEQKFENDWVQGTPDIIPCVAEDIYNFGLIDIKSSWDIFSFFASKNEPLKSAYEWQMQAYMWLTGIEKATVFFVLTETPEEILKQEAKNFCYKKGIKIDFYEGIYNEIQEKMTYKNIPLEERVFSFEVLKNEELHEKIIEKVEESRKYLKLIK